MQLPSLHQIAIYVVVLFIGGAGGWVAAYLGFPLPFLLGGFLATGAAVLGGVRVMGAPLEFPLHLRNAFIVIIGVLIGGSLSGNLLTTLAQSWLSFLAVLVFVAVAQAGNFLILRSIGGYDPRTAFFAGTPGGLIESITLGEAVGGDARILTIQQFSRIIIVISTVPFLVSIWHGSAVGSAAGASFAEGQTGVAALDWAILIATGAIGFVAGRRLRLPAPILTGPVLLSALVHGLDLTQAHPPDWLVSVAQWIIGSALGMRFAGLDRKTLVKALGLATLCTGFMFAIGLGLALLLSLALDTELLVLFIVFAPGGVTEMGLIALSLNANPFFVTLHHLLRIAATVLMGSYAARLLARKEAA